MGALSAPSVTNHARTDDIVLLTLAPARLSDSAPSAHEAAQEATN
jgi:hypothetical protein